MVSNTLSDAFNLTRLTVDEQLPAVVDTAGHEKLTDDFNTSRTNIKSLTKVAMTAVDELAILATQSQNHKFYEALTSAIKAAGELNRQMVDIHGAVREASNIKDNHLGKPNQIQNNLFITTSDLQDILERKNMKNVIEH